MTHDRTTADHDPSRPSGPDTSLGLPDAGNPSPLSKNERIINVMERLLADVSAFLRDPTMEGIEPIMRVSLDNGLRITVGVEPATDYIDE